MGHNYAQLFNVITLLFFQISKNPPKSSIFLFQNFKIKNKKKFSFYQISFKSTILHIFLK